MSRFENVFVSSFTWCVYLHKGAQFIRHSNLPISAQVPFAGKRLHHTCPCLPHLVCTRYTETRYRCNSDLKNLDFWQHGLRPKEEKTKSKHYCCGHTWRRDTRENKRESNHHVHRLSSHWHIHTFCHLLTQNSAAATLNIWIGKAKIMFNFMKHLLYKYSF